MTAQNTLGYQDTPLIPGTTWHVHDGERPQPPIVTPSQNGAPPSDAIVLFDGTSLDKWVSTRDAAQPAPWKLVEDDAMEVLPRSGDIQTKAAIGSCQLHLEFASPAEVNGNGQGRGNSGVFFMGVYEVQVLDCYDNPTYPDGTTGGIYGQFPPLANVCRPPAHWNVYDFIWNAPEFDGDHLVKPAKATVLLNGVVLHHAQELQGPTQHKATTQYVPHASAAPLKLQDHGDAVRFRNIWYRPL